MPDFPEETTLFRHHRSDPVRGGPLRIFEAVVTAVHAFFVRRRTLELEPFVRVQGGRLKDDHPPAGALFARQLAADSDRVAVLIGLDTTF